MARQQASERDDVLSFQEEACEVLLNGVGADPKVRPNLLVRPALRRELKYVQLAATQVRPLFRG